MGDINRDSIIDLKDLLMFKQYLIDGEQFKCRLSNLDLNGNSEINEDDLDILKRLINEKSDRIIKYDTYEILNSPQ